MAFHLWLCLGVARVLKWLDHPSHISLGDSKFTPSTIREFVCWQLDFLCILTRVWKDLVLFSASMIAWSFVSLSFAFVLRMDLRKFVFASFIFLWQVGLSSLSGLPANFQSPQALRDCLMAAVTWGFHLRDFFKGFIIFVGVYPGILDSVAVFSISVKPLIWQSTSYALFVCLYWKDWRIWVRTESLKSSRSHLCHLGFTGIVTVSFCFKQYLTCNLAERRVWSDKFRGCFPTTIVGVWITVVWDFVSM